MKIAFNTNIDNYKKNCFPENLPFVPRKGEKVMVKSNFIRYFEEKKLPTRLEVVDIIYTDYGVDCELWYNKQDLEFAKLAGAKVF